MTTFAAEQVVLTWGVVCGEGEQCVGEDEQCMWVRMSSVWVRVSSVGEGGLCG